MLIRFTVENFLSFRDETELIMFPGKGPQPDRHVFKGDFNDDIPVLKTTVIFGANASGKSNLIRAIETARNMVINLPQRDEYLDDNRFKLDKTHQNKPTKFEFEIRGSSSNYAYGFIFDNKIIIEEWLFKISKNNQTPVFERNTLESKFEINDDPYIMDVPSNYDRMQMMSQDVLPNQLFLTSVNNRNIDDIDAALDLLEVFNWFLSLIIISPRHRYRKHFVLPYDDEFSKTFKKLIMQFDTGIDGVDLRPVPKDQFYKKIDKDIIDDANKKLKQKQIFVHNTPDYNQYLLSKNEDNEIEIEEIMFHHLGADEDCWLEMSEESDGTKRLANLIPILIEASLSKNTVFCVDEIGRSLHPHLSHFFINAFLDSSKRTQIITSTHDTGLLDLKMLRKDEIWFTEKDQQGVSHLTSLSEFEDIRPDLDIEKGYLKGRYGAIPVVNAFCLDQDA